MNLAFKLRMMKRSVEEAMRRTKIGSVTSEQ